MGDVIDLLQWVTVVRSAKTTSIRYSCCTSITYISSYRLILKPA